MPTLLLAALVFGFPSVAVSTVGGGSYVYTLLLVGGLIWGRRWRPLERWEKRVLLGLLAVLLLMVVSLFTSSDPDAGLRALERYARIASIGLVYPMLRRFDFPFHRALGAGAAVACAVLALQAWYEVDVLGLERAAGGYHSIAFGNVAALWGCLGVLFILDRMRGWFRVVAASGVAGAATYAVVLSGSRGAWLFLLVLPFVLAYLFRRELAASGRARWAAVALVLTAGAAVAWQSEAVDQRMDEAVSDLRTYAQDPAAATSLGHRINLWRNALLLAGDHPIFGTGIGSYQAEMRTMVADGRSRSPFVAGFAHAHSIYLDALASTGAVGLVVMLAGYLGLPLWTFGRLIPAARTREERYCAVAGVLTILAFAVFGLTEALWSRNAFVNTYVVCVSVFLAGAPRPRALRGSRARA